MICTLSFDGAAQRRDVLPHVGTIKDYPATGLMTGCANLYFYRTPQLGSSNDAYVFLARGDGSDAWMNLGGLDVRLRQIKLLSQEYSALRRYNYRWGKLRISVVIEAFKPENAPVAEDDSMFKMKIILRQGRAVKVVRALGDSDC